MSDRITWKPAESKYFIESRCGGFRIAKRLVNGVPTYDCSRRVKQGTRTSWEAVRGAGDRILVFGTAQEAKDHLDRLEPF